MRTLIIFLLLLIPLNTFAQKQKEKTVTLKSVRGEYSVILEYADISGREAVQLAREDAKRKAIERVCGVRVNIWDQIETSSAGDIFNSISVNQIDGEVVEFVIKEEGHKHSTIRSSETIFYCIADITVKKSVEVDPNFYVAINGLKSVYNVGDALSFRITPYQDCYLKIFLLEDDMHGCLLYPNKYDQSRLLSAKREVEIPDASHYQFELHSNQRPKEINRIVFVFTKSERAFDEEETSRAEIEKWIAKIPNDQKYLHFAVIEILQ